jgi:hypothetical protein
MTPRSLLGRATSGLIIGAFVVSACGGQAATTAPVTQAPSTAAPATVAPATEAPVTPAPATIAPPATLAPGADPAAEYEIGAPYEFEALDPSIAALFQTSMEEALGSMAGVFQMGFRSAVRDGETDAWVIVMRFPDLPISKNDLLDQIAQGATASGGGTVESITIDGEPARVISANGQALVISLVGDDVVMTIGTARKATVDVATAVSEAN